MKQLQTLMNIQAVSKCVCLGKVTPKDPVVEEPQYFAIVGLRKRTRANQQRHLLVNREYPRQRYYARGDPGGNHGNDVATISVYPTSIDRVEAGQQEGVCHVLE